MRLFTQFIYTRREYTTTHADLDNRSLKISLLYYFAYVLTDFMIYFGGE